MIIIYNEIIKIMKEKYCNSDDEKWIISHKTFNFSII